MVSRQDGAALAVAAARPTNKRKGLAVGEGAVVALPHPIGTSSQRLALCWHAAVVAEKKTGVDAAARRPVLPCAEVRFPRQDGAYQGYVEGGYPHLP